MMGKGQGEDEEDEEEKVGEDKWGGQIQAEEQT